MPIITVSRNFTNPQALLIFEAAKKWALSRTPPIAVPDSPTGAQMQTLIEAWTIDLWRDSAVGVKANTDGESGRVAGRDSAAATLTGI